MKAAKFIFPVLVFLLLASCGSKEKKISSQILKKEPAVAPVILPLDKGFSEYIAGYTSGIIPSNSAIEIRFTPEFAAKAKKDVLSGLFTFDPSIKGKAEWKDETTLIFTPSRFLDAGKSYTGELDLSKLGEVTERLTSFPIRIQTLKKDFTVTTGTLECSPSETNTYILNGDITASDVISNTEVESYLEARLEKKKLDIKWDHSGNLVHKFIVTGISRSDKLQFLTLSWDGSSAGVKQKGSTLTKIPKVGEFSVLDVKIEPGEGQKMNIVFSDPVDASKNLDGLIYLSNAIATSSSVNSNIVTLVPVNPINGIVTLNVESSVMSIAGAELKSEFTLSFDFTGVKPGIMLVGKGEILPSSKNLIFPFMAANLKAVDLKIIKVYENNLPYFLQENDLGNDNSIKRFGSPIFSGRVDLNSGAAAGPGTWNLHTIDLADYIDVEPGILYKVQLSMRKSYSLITSCPLTDEEKRYEEKLDETQAAANESWGDGDNYYDEGDEGYYYSSDFRWEDRNDPCKEAYFSPDKTLSKNILASNLGLIAKMGEDNKLHIMVNDLPTALPVNEVSLDVYDFQMQLIVSGNSNPEGSANLFCGRKPFLIIAKKDKDRNYLKINDGSSLSLSSFDVSGNKPENGIKGFVYSERDVWRPGDSIYLAIFIKDIKSDLPPDHPVQFEFINPSEQRIDNQIQKLNGSNLLVFTTKTSADAVTGNYHAQFKVGGATFTKRVRIETIKPNRLKINLSFPGEILGGENRTSTGTLNVKWLNGAVAKNLKTSVDYMLKHSKTVFDKYSQYDFDDPVNKFSSETVSTFDGAIDENGKATFRFSPGDNINAPGMLTAVFTAKVQEQGGDESITQASYKYAPYHVFAGINLPGLKGKSRMLFTDVNNEVKVVTVDENGKPVRSEAEMTIYKLDYRWWWESDNEDLASYISNQIYKSVFKQKLTTSGGEGTFNFNIAKNEWGRYLIKVTTPGGHSTGRIVLVDWPWEYGMKGNSEGATLLAISTDKEKYNPGDEIKLTFPSPENSRAIITLENATGVLDEIRVPTQKANTIVTLKATPEMAPNVYAYVSVIQPHSQKINDMPIRFYGVIPVMVEDPGSRLSPQIEVADEIRSQKPFEIKVSEANRKAMTYTVAVVDEGLLDITGFRTPDPWSYFYGREALGVRTWDLYDNVLGAFGGTLDRVFAVGGDETVVDKSANKAQRFVPVVKFLGPFILAAGKTNTHKITLPQYTGSVRVMIIAGNERAFGGAEKSVIVKDPLMVLVTAPRVISPGEKAALPVTIFIQKENITDITLRAEGNELIRFEEGTKTITASGIGEKDAEFTFTTGNKMGKGKIKVTAEGGGEKAVYELEIDVRSPNPPETRAEVKLLKPGEKWEAGFNPFGLEGTNSAHLEVSTLPSVDLGKRIDFLLEYPHGCSEQITSAAFPQLWLKDLSDNNADIANTSSVNVKAAIAKLQERQMISGGIALWPSSPEPDSWVTSYAGHFLLEAERLGYNIPSGFRQKWISYQSRAAREWHFDNNFKQSANDQAYRLFTLALAGEPEKGAMNRLRESKAIPKLSRWLLAAAFATSGHPEAASDLLDVRVTDTEPEYCSYYYGSRIRDKSIILYTLTLLKNQDQALNLVKEISDDLCGEYWYSTQSVSWALCSYMKWAGSIPGDKTSAAKIKVTTNGDKKEHSINPKQMWTGDLKIISGNNTVTLENSSETPLYATLIRKGVPLLSDVSKDEKGIGMKVEYVNMDLKPVDPKSLPQGTSFMMVAKISNNTFTRIENIALTQMVPSGWEIQNTRLFEASYGIKESVYDYRDFRDDRVMTYFLLDPGDTKTFVLILTAAYKGEFNQPSIWAEAMYTENCYARIPGTTVKVTGE
jgi:Large extracellular alpha-helical protein